MTGTAPNRKPPMLTAALVYHHAGLNVIPVDATKKPLVRWKEFQTRRVTVEELHEWYAQHPLAGIAFVCGAVSGRVVVDLDPRHADPSWLEHFRRVVRPTPTLQTPRGGLHFHFQSPEPAHIKVTALRPGLDYQGEGACAILPPTTTIAGTYTWLGGWRAQPPLTPLPYPVRHFLEAWDRERAREEQRAAAPRRGSGGAGRGRRLELDQVLPRLRKLRWHGNQGEACCPAHDDRAPSLSVKRAHDGPILLYCFGGCSFEQIVRALDL